MWGVLGETDDDPAMLEDDMPGTGPEIIEIPSPHNGVFTVVVHDYPGSIYSETNTVTLDVRMGLNTAVFTAPISGEDSYTYICEIDTLSGDITSLL